MAAPAGPCEWCGGPQWWTIIRGELWVKCQSGCEALPGLEGLEPPVESDREEPVQSAPVDEGVRGC